MGGGPQVTDRLTASAESTGCSRSIRVELNPHAFIPHDGKQLLNEPGRIAKIFRAAIVTRSLKTHYPPSAPLACYGLKTCRVQSLRDLDGASYRRTSA